MPRAIFSSEERIGWTTAPAWLGWLRRRKEGLGEQQTPPRHSMTPPR